MEYGWQCFTGESLKERKQERMKCRLTIFGLLFVLVILLTFAVATFSYAGDTLTLDQAIETALRNNPGLKAADAQIEAADAGVLK